MAHPEDELGGRRNVPRIFDNVDVTHANRVAIARVVLVLAVRGQVDARVNRLYCGVVASELNFHPHCVPRRDGVWGYYGTVSTATRAAAREGAVATVGGAPVTLLHPVRGGPAFDTLFDALLPPRYILSVQKVNIGSPYSASLDSIAVAGWKYGWSGAALGADPKHVGEGLPAARHVDVLGGPCDRAQNPVMVVHGRQRYGNVVAVH
mmetsp:Transcript_28871/g.75734  ORF Transcript_28871/g.75734 Transcript_28871/m.75734 type:complete len:207 (-) Transcript_28871:932-1552(-)